MPQSPVTLRLASGLRLNLLADAAAPRAAALMQIDAGSYHEPSDWPGLAHLLEHMLFRGSRAFDGDQRLMSWVPAHGGRLNATTRETATHFFFELDGERFADGLARLIDMLAAPLLALPALAQEVEVIDAEYQLLCQDADTLCEAAQQQAFDGIAAMRRFTVGNRRAFGDDMPALCAALRDFHRRYYHTANMTLWLQAPLPLAQLRQLAETLTQSLPSGVVADSTAAPRLIPRDDRRLNVPGLPQLRFTFALNAADAAARDGLRLLDALLQDEAPGSLMAHLRRSACCDAVRLQHTPCADGRALLTFIFSVNRGSAAEAAIIENALLGWLQQLPSLSAAQREHYARRGNQDFMRLTPLDQLRARAFGLPPLAENAPWPPCLAELTAGNLRRLLVSAETAAESRMVQGLPLALTPFVAAHSARRPPDYRFYPRHDAPSTPLALPAERAPLSWRADGDHPPVLLLRPAPSTPLASEQAALLTSALRTLTAEITHQGGSLGVTQSYGVWTLQVSGDAPLLCRALSQVNQRLTSLDDALKQEAALSWQRAQLRAQGEIAVRRLAAQLPEVLAPPVDAVCWQATLFAGDAALHQQLSQLLSAFPAPIVVAQDVAPIAAAQPVRLSDDCADDRTLLLYYPLADATPMARLALRLLAQLYAPRFFQRLRVELNIGYVAHCAYHRCADRDGMLFALQSPRCSLEQLHNYTREFLQQMRQELAALDATALQQAKETLAQSLQSSAGDYWQRTRDEVLEQRPDAVALAALDLPALLDGQRRLFTAD
ncbi:pyrroloquinoline quinone biosynthesis protein PqqF [Serratia rubidaea]|uniref:pyrroloquinoline quinone biosynthesis protein PqqF n=1 Tax=Serratia rubidaea TaxID=61652 RepID=UPI002432DE32|nr:pyrroloquinoline quinone biosynthesis protein PqqF [Serratia rubidaea]MCR0998168.1 pyrroloquinoline quinone biosynthesis protein PqqF [Serratia rubidaea]